MIDFFPYQNIGAEKSQNGRRKMDGNPKRQTQRNELHRVREKISHRPADSETVRRIAAVSAVHIVCAKTCKAG